MMYLDEFYSADNPQPYTAGAVEALNANNPTIVPVGAEFVLVKP